MTLSRRAFLQSASLSLGAGFVDLPSLTSSQQLEQTFAEIRANLLNMINEQREAENVPNLQMDELATEIATKHAIDMATNDYVSHWGRDGLKPYHRYSFAGGTDATQENISAADNTWSTKNKDLKQDTAYLHVRLYNEVPPNDGHRRAILAPQQTHVGIGLAVDQLRLRTVELFVAKHVEVRPVSRQVKPGEEVPFTGKFLKRYRELTCVEVFYEPLPKTPEMSWLREPHAYSWPPESKVLRPKLQPPFVYTDRTRGEVDVFPDGTFSVPVKFFRREPGIYTIVTWLKGGKTSKGFPVTEVCVRAE